MPFIIFIERSGIPQYLLLRLAAQKDAATSPNDPIKLKKLPKSSFFYLILKVKYYMYNL